MNIKSSYAKCSQCNELTWLVKILNKYKEIIGGNDNE